MSEALIRSWNGDYTGKEFDGVFILGLAGLRGSGKTAVADAVVKSERVKVSRPVGRRMSFARHLKDVLRTLADSKEDVEKDACLYEESAFTGRDFLTLFGAEFVRDRIGENFWVDVLTKRILDLSRFYNLRATLVVIDDVRYPNEYALVKALGVCVLLERDGTESARGAHSSEEPEKLGVPDVVQNNGSIDDTVSQVLAVVKKHPRWRGDLGSGHRLS